jgi:cob(I)alamin adenosyltransferase
VLTLGEVPDDIRTLLGRVQNELFDLGADLSTPITPDPAYPPLRVEPEYITRLEEACDTYNADLPTLRSFLLPGGSPTVALLHTARIVVRRAERAVWAAVEEHGDTVNPLTAQYLNRLSDLLFILGRYVAKEGDEVLWKPGGER